VGEIRVAFLARFAHPLRSGQKVMTSRNGKLGEVGDTFRAEDCVFVLTHVYREKLDTVARVFFAEEGCSSADEFRSLWGEIHPGRGFVPVDRVWVHRFRRLDPDGKPWVNPQRRLEDPPDPPAAPPAEPPQGTPIVPLADPGGTFRTDGLHARHP
jgi:hypothetical protein